MWTNRQSCFLLIQFKKQPVATIPIPLTLPVFEIALASLRDSLEFWECVFPNLFSKLTAKHNKPQKQFKVSMLFSECILLIHELRKYKSLELLHIDNGKMVITMRLL